MAPFRAPVTLAKGLYLHDIICSYADASCVELRKNLAALDTISYLQINH
jgi:hypothetical protein